MAMNTAYLGSSASVPGNLNTSYLSTGITEITSGLSVWGQISFLNGSPNFTSGVSATTGQFSSTLTVGGLATFTSGVTVDGALNVNSNHTQANFLSYQTSASAASTILPDGAFGVYYLSVSSMALAFRSGVTTYTVRCTAASVL